LLTQTRAPNVAAGPARLPLEWWPASRRNGGPLHVGTVAHFNVGMVARFASEYPARFRRNSHLQAGVDISVIALWLGHESIKTTQVYLHAHLALKEAALAKVKPFNGQKSERYLPGDRLLAFLDAL